MGRTAIRQVQARSRPEQPPQSRPQDRDPPQPAPVKEDKRVFGVLPNYRTTEETGVYMPITSKQKLTIATKDTIDYPLFLLGGGLCRVWRSSPMSIRVFGQGVAGFAHRYGTAYADQAIGNYMTEGSCPSCSMKTRAISGGATAPNGIARGTRRRASS